MMKLPNAAGEFKKNIYCLEAIVTSTATTIHIKIMNTLYDCNQ